MDDTPLVNEEETVNAAETSNTQEAASPAAAMAVEQEVTTETFRAASTGGIRRRKVLATTTGVDKIINYLEKQSCRTAQQEEGDEIDKLFRGYAAAVRKLMPRRQTLIKYRIAKLIMEAELEEMDNASPFTPSSNSNSNTDTLQHSHNFCPVDDMNFSGPPSTGQVDCNIPPSISLRESSSTLTLLFFRLIINNQQNKLKK
ncbi:hypothetical protein QE152_g38718 [Popillia japonica]|uniref:BESS domain-containing protein n=1 Tax=Popillia japonica TaxID=7064 RepID=A0AAW1HVS4_POPJA